MRDPVPPKPAKLLERMREALWLHHYAYRTEQSYLDWARRYILFHGKRHPADLGAGEIGAFLTHLAAERHVSASTQNQAKAALLFLYRRVHVGSANAGSPTFVCPRGESLTGGYS